MTVFIDAGTVISYNLLFFINSIPPSLYNGRKANTPVELVDLVVNRSNGITIKNPLSKLPSPNISNGTSVSVAQAPILMPLSKRRESSKVTPLSPAKYLAMRMLVKRLYFGSS